MTAQAAEFLENELLDMTFPCSELDHQGILDEIVEELCRKDSEDDTGLDGVDGSISMSDVEEALGAYDRIFNEVERNLYEIETISESTLECMGFPELNECEKEVLMSNQNAFSSLALNWVSANGVTHQRMGTNSQDDCSDAFRHTFFNALNSWSLGEELAREFGIAHECETDSDNATKMDLHNNEIGYNIIRENPTIISLMNAPSDRTDLHHQGINLIMNTICDRLESGEMKIFTDPSDPDRHNNEDDNLISSEECICLPL